MKTAEKTKMKTRMVEKTLTIDAAIADVWKALTDAEELVRWFPLQAEVTPGAGGKMKWTWDDKYAWEFEIDEWQPEKKLKISYTLNQDHFVNEEQMNPDSIMMNSSAVLAVDYELETQDGKTVLRLVHSGFGTDDKWDELYDGVRRGWNQELLSLKHYVEHHLGRDRSVAWAVGNPKDSPVQVWEEMGASDILSGLGKPHKEGERYVLSTPDGEEYTGTVLYHNPPWDFFATVDNLNNSLIRVKQEKLDGLREADIWLSAYGLPEEEVSKFKAYWELKLRSKFS
ncbi:MAG: SRPBCC domain-containing protein [Bacteroidota bacterium]